MFVSNVVRGVWKRNMPDYDLFGLDWALQGKFPRENSKKQDPESCEPYAMKKESMASLT